VTGAPFRDLFVDLPAALFETLKGIATEAVRRAKVDSYPPGNVERVSTLFDSAQYGRLLCERYGWLNAEMTRSPYDRTTEIGVRWPCKHSAVIVVQDNVLESATDVVDALDHVTARHGRPCQCMQREALS
jgi:hypothetical protein